MNKKIYNLLGLILFGLVVIGIGFKIDITINELDVPLSSGIIQEQAQDIILIPDKYNTGCDENKIVDKITESKMVGDIYICNYGSTSMGIRITNNMPDEIIFENLDFSEKPFVLANDTNKSDKCTFIFNNCKFSSLRTSNQGDSLVKYVYSNCSFTHFTGSNSVFNSCYFGSGSDGDGINPVRNVEMNNCMIADLIQKSDVLISNHVDGIQMFGDSSKYKYDNVNIHINNCRFEIPYLSYTYSVGKLNCPITFTMRYSNASNISFENCYVNGGAYYSIMVYQGDYKTNEVSFKDIYVGGARKSSNLKIDNWEGVSFENIMDTDSLYVGSVWRDSQLHLSVTNDTNIARKLLVVTDKGTHTIDVEACPVTIDLDVDLTDYNDLPFDKEIIVDDSEWVICYDITGNDIKQIRFVNWSNSEVRYVPETMETDDDVFIDEDIDELEVVVNGQCGKNVNYVLYNDGTLYLSGKGSTYNYNSKKTSPWFEFNDDIDTIIIDEGISCLGNQLFARCRNVKTVQLSDSVEIIGNLCFMLCEELEFINIPKSVKYIYDDAFRKTGLLNIDYDGTEEEWKLVSIGANNDRLMDATISFVEPDVFVYGTCGKNVEWNLNITKGVLHISGVGYMTNYNSKNIPEWMEYKDDIVEVIFDDGVLNVGNSSFVGCDKLKEITFSSTINTIGGNAFSQCSSICEISLPKSVKEIGGHSFAKTSLSTIFYDGTKAEYNNISIASTNSLVLNAEIKCKE